MRTLSSRLLAALLFAAPFAPLRAQEPPAAAMPASGAQELTRLGDEYWSWTMARYPLWATFIKHPGHDDRLEDITPEGRTKERAEASRLLKRLAAIDPAGLTEADRVSWEILKLRLELVLEAQKHKAWQWEVDHMNGPQAWIPQVVALAQPMRSQEDAERLLARMRAFGPFFDAQIANLREGMLEGRTAARIGVEKTISQLKDLLAKPAHETSFAEAAKRLPSELQDRYLPVVLREADAAPRSALEKYLKFLEADYLAVARAEQVGLGALPGGEEAYRFRIRYHTTLDDTADELHQAGLDELASIHAEMKAIAERAGHRGPLPDYFEVVRKDSANFFKTREEVVASAKEQVERTRSRLPEFFGVLPKTALEVRPIPDYQEKNDAAARYFQPPDDLSRPGIYYINTYEPASRPRFGMAALAAHEGLPGHHLQIALSIENRALPDFRRHSGFNAFVEGWALYTERLAEEMGLYQDDLARLGMLSAQALRAARLVVDTGLHAKGWTRSQAIDFMKAATLESEGEIVAEVDRYIVWPGQALAYMVGSREIRRIRREAEERLGPAFNIKAFHDAVLRNGAIPLPTLDRIVAAALPSPPTAPEPAPQPAAEPAAEPAPTTEPKAPAAAE